MTTAGDDVWYACYGSNLLSERFLCYLVGGRPPLASRANPGARDPSPPRDSRPLRIPHRLYFAERSASWANGGVAFLAGDPSEEPAAYARAYRITTGQFRDVFLQENGLDPREHRMELPRLAPGESLVALDRWYGRLLDLGELMGSPVCTFTRPEDAPASVRNPPSKAYLETVAAGLLESFPEASTEELLAYLMSTEASRLEEATVRAHLERPGAR